MNDKDFIKNTSGVHRPRHSRTRHPRDRRGDTGAAEDRIRLDTIGRTLSILEATTNPYLSHLMVEDACWFFAHDQWAATRPHRWNRKQRQRWQDEGDWLRAKRERIEDLAREIGVPPQTVPQAPRHHRLLQALRRLVWP